MRVVTWPEPWQSRSKASWDRYLTVCAQTSPVRATQYDLDETTGNLLRVDQTSQWPHLLRKREIFRSLLLIWADGETMPHPWTDPCPLGLSVEEHRYGEVEEKHGNPAL